MGRGPSGRDGGPCHPGERALVSELDALALGRGVGEAPGRVGDERAGPHGNCARLKTWRITVADSACAATNALINTVVASSNYSVLDPKKIVYDLSAAGRLTPLSFAVMQEGRAAIREAHLGPRRVQADGRPRTSSTGGRKDRGVVASVRLVGVGRQSGVETMANAAHIWTFRGRQDRAADRVPDAARSPRSHGGLERE